MATRGVRPKLVRTFDVLKRTEAAAEDAKPRAAYIKYKKKRDYVNVCLLSAGRARRTVM